jgi:farnesyl diphosphate synthase
LVVSLAQAAGHAGMAGGQMLDLGGKAGLGSGEQAILEMQGLKTGALFRFACEAGAILGRAAEPEGAALSSFANHAGLAFQIADDILDAEALTADIGKTAGKDRAQGKATFVELYGLDGAKRRCGELVARATGALDIFGGRAAPLAAAARFMIDRRS